MKRVMSASVMSCLVALLVPACEGEGQDGLSIANLESGDPKVKHGTKFGLPYGLCEDLTLDAQIFFQDQEIGSEREIFAAELKQRMDAGLPTMVVDVRPEFQYSAAHIPSSVNIPLNTLFTEALCPNGSGEDPKLVALPLDGTPVVLVSSNGYAAALAAGVLGTLSYNVFVLRFGLIAWAGSTDVQIHRHDRTQRFQGLGGPLAH
jgi:rhodanese-related sulfurtransferase